jgi:hypothetical protein
MNDFETVGTLKNVCSCGNKFISFVWLEKRRKKIVVNSYYGNDNMLDTVNDAVSFLIPYSLYHSSFMIIILQLLASSWYELSVKRLLPVL